MNLPIEKKIKLKETDLDHLNQILRENDNLTCPLVFDLLELKDELQKEFIGAIENYYITQNQSFSLPYPIYVLTKFEKTISELNLLQSEKNLPHFYRYRDIKLNIKESQILIKTKLLQQEIKNLNETDSEKNLKQFGRNHKKIYLLEEERTKYLSILNKLKKRTKYGL